MTYFQFKKYIAASLEAVAGEYAAYEAEKIACHIFGLDRRALSLVLREKAPDKKEEAENIIARRKSGEPLAYILGNVDFFGLNLYVNEACLTPRADTEVIVEKALDLLDERRANVLDICTGSGCIAVSVLAERPDTRAVAVDKFPATLALAMENARRNGVADRLIPLCADVLAEDFAPTDLPLDAILSNPPYIPTDVIPTLEPELSAEPVAALDGGKDGLLFYRTLLRTQAKHLTPGGFFLFEIGFDQADALRRYGEERGFSQCRVLKDYGGNDRVVHLSAPTA